ncbi:OmpA family protein [Vibrio algivorus]|uniref:OmpA family protein n=1 Tax=Vibrio algivorus TaxID=1667024 RepID=A0A557NVC3_9VIBR|nr:OmpA family protein [Vibrio algivorus]TVO32275.1 OmpA family protein [Vibrio algivorus]
MSDDSVIIRPRVNKGKANVSHGGWKVAMADLMISLMCLFLILWLLAIMDVQDKKALINYFAEGNLQPQYLGEGIGNSVSPIKLPHVATSREETDLHRIDDDSLIEGEVNTQPQLEALAHQIEQELQELDGTGSITALVTPQGLKLILTDSSQGDMFYRGSARMTPYYQDLLLGLAPIFARIDNSMVLTGHTDSSRFKSPAKTNWELSSERANSARYYLNRGGVSHDKIFQVSGMAESAPLHDDPASSENRRIEIFLLTRQAQQMLEDIYKVNPSPQPTEAEDVAVVETFNKERAQATRAAALNLPVTPAEVLKRTP